MRPLVLLAAAALAALALTTASTAAAARKVTATDGPGFTITMSAKAVKAGTYTITVRDRSPIHNFHLTGPGLNKKTSVAKVGTYEVDGEAEERHLPLRLRPARLDHARRPQGHLDRPRPDNPGPEHSKRRPCFQGLLFVELPDSNR